MKSLIKTLLRERLEESIRNKVASLALGASMALGGLGSAKAQSSSNQQSDSISTYQDTNKNSDWVKIKSLLPKSNNEKIDISDFSQEKNIGGNISWKKNNTNLDVSTNDVLKDSSKLVIRFTINDIQNQTNLLKQVQKIFEDNNIRSTKMEWNGDDIEAGAIVDIKNYNLSTNIINQILKLMSV
jgi:hypothetical protein